MPDPVATFAEANQARLAAERGGMEVVATAGPTNLADTGTLSLSLPDNSPYHNLYVEVSGDYTGSGNVDELQLDGIGRLALLRAGTWLTSATSETLVSFSASASSGDSETATFPLSLENPIRNATSPFVRVAASGPIDNAQLRIIGIRNP